MNEYKIARIKLEQVNELYYLDSMIKKDNNTKCDVKRQIAQAKKAFAEKKEEAAIKQYRCGNQEMLSVIIYIKCCLIWT